MGGLHLHQPSPAGDGGGPAQHPAPVRAQRRGYMAASLGGSRPGGTARPPPRLPAGLVPEHRAAALRSLAGFWSAEVPRFGGAGCYGQVPSETLALAVAGGVSPQRCPCLEQLSAAVLL